jgi:hypothetical protein
MKMTGLFRSTELTTITIDAPNYATAKELLEAQIPEGWQLQHIQQEE